MFPTCIFSARSLRPVVQPSPLWRAATLAVLVPAAVLGPRVTAALRRCPRCGLGSCGVAPDLLRGVSPPPRAGWAPVSAGWLRGGLVARTGSYRFICRSVLGRVVVHPMRTAVWASSHRSLHLRVFGPRCLAFSRFRPRCPRMLLACVCCLEVSRFGDCLAVFGVSVGCPSLWFGGVPFGDCLSCVSVEGRLSVVPLASPLVVLPAGPRLFLTYRLA